MCKAISVVSSDDVGVDDIPQKVALLLEIMNNASAEVNELEKLLSTSEVRYKEHLASWTALYTKLRMKCGKNFDRMKPYFDHVENASHCAQEAVLQFALAATREDAADVDSDSSDDVRGERERREEHCMRILDEYRDAQEAFRLEHCRRGNAAMQRIISSFRLLRQRQAKMLLEQSRMERLRKRADSAKKTYKQALRDLDTISCSIHAARGLPAIAA